MANRLLQCADITFVEDGREDPMPEGMCQNSSTINFNLVYSTSDAWHTMMPLNLANLGLVTTLSIVAAWWLS